MVINSAHNISVYVGTYMYLLDGHTIYVVIYIETFSMLCNILFSFSACRYVKDHTKIIASWSVSVSL